MRLAGTASPELDDRHHVEGMIDLTVAFRVESEPSVFDDPTAGGCRQRARFALTTGRGQEGIAQC